jgi:NAD(P)-dependent dehydrogenase (short-subunit alcohol dehydrogenase family)
MITGATRGIGLAIAVELATAGASIALNHHPSMREEEIKVAEETMASLGATWMHVIANVGEGAQARQAVQQIQDRFGRLDVLVNNAGITRDKTLRKLTDEDWLEVINNNLNSVFFCTSAVVPGMIERQFGRIVSISSVVAQTGNFGQTNYSAAKGGIISFTKSAALELARHNITVNAIAPGFTDTGMLSTIPEDVRDQIRAKIPLGRFAKPREIARAVLFLVSDGDYITGQQLNVNGGLYM